MRAKALGWRTTKHEKNTKSEVLGVQEVGDAVNEIYCVPTNFIHSRK